MQEESSVLPLTENDVPRPVLPSCVSLRTKAPSTARITFYNGWTYPIKLKGIDPQKGFSLPFLAIKTD